MDSQRNKILPNDEEVNKLKRLRWAKENQDNAFENVIFADETER